MFSSSPMIEQLPVTVGFELEFTASETQVLDIADAMRRAGYPVSCNIRWRHTPEEVSAAGTWDIKTDSSCGFEAVSPVIRTVSELKRAAEVARIIRRHGGRINEKCGFHVHVGLKAVDRTNYAPIFAFLTRYQSAFFLMVSEPRTRSSYCKPLADYTVGLLRRLAHEGFNQGLPYLYERFNGIWDDKNVWLNGRTFSRIGTLEFRLFEGTLDYDEIIGVIVFIEQIFGQILHNGKRVSWGAASARDNRMLFYTLLQQAGCYGKKTFDPDLAKLARRWAIRTYQRRFKPAKKVPRRRPVREVTDDPHERDAAELGARRAEHVFTSGPTVVVTGSGTSVITPVAGASFWSTSITNTTTT